MKKLLSLLLVLAAVAVYFPILGHDFLYFWDDQWVVMNHYTEGGFTLTNLRLILTEYYHGQYAPLNELLYLILYNLFGYNPFFFHAASLILHALNTLLLFVVVEQLLRLSVSVKVGAGQAVWIAFLTALLFVVHPFNVESVAWMSASKILVYAFYYLLATYCFLLYIKHQKLWYYLLSAFLFVCSFLGKEQAVTFPLWVLLMYWFTGHQSLKDKKLWLTVAPLLLLSLVFGIMTMLSQAASGGGALSAETSYPVWQRFVYACYSLVEYMFKCVFPFKLSYLYPFPSVVGEALPAWLLLYPLLLTVTLIAFGKYILQNKLILLSLLFFLIHIAVALHLIPLSRFAVVADRYVYLSSAGVCLMLAYGAVYLFEKCKRRGKVITASVLAAYILYLGIYANIRSRVWYNTDTLKKEIRELLKDREDYKGDANTWNDKQQQSIETNEEASYNQKPTGK